MHPFQLGTDTAALVDEVRKKHMRDGDETWEGTHKRVARALFPDDAGLSGRLNDLLSSGRACPAGRILAGAGSGLDVTWWNCFVSPLLQDSMRTDDAKPGKGIMEALANVAYSMQAGGGVGTDFSPLRPKDALVARLMTSASGPLAFMDLWDAMCRTIMSAGHRRGAMMATLRCDHPDLLDFVRAKRAPGRLTMFNVSVLITDAFMAAKEADAEWDLGHPARPFDPATIVEVKDWKNPNTGVIEPWYVYKRVRAREVWDEIMRSTYVHAEPGVIFIDRVNAWNNLWYAEKVQCTNPCFTGETRVWTAQGHRSFFDLAETGEDVQVLTLNPRGRFVYRWMRNPRMTRRDIGIVEILLTRPAGKGRPWATSTITCTPDHIFYLKYGDAVRAEDLRAGHRISSVYRAPRGKGYLGLSNHTHGMMEHHVPFENVEGLGSTIDAHHIDENKRNNEPSNLELKAHNLHSSEHKFGDDNPMRKHPEKNHFRRRDNKGSNNGRYRRDIDDEVLKELQKSGLSYAAIAAQMNCSEYTVGKRLGWSRPLNHIVKSMRVVGRKADVYCGTVDETHKFFIAVDDNSGVLVANCGEQAMSPDSNCNLFHVNLSRCVAGTPFTDECALDYTALQETVDILVRAADNVVDLSPAPTEAQRAKALEQRRIGLGITGLANMLMFLRQRYGSPGAIKTVERVMNVIRDRAYRTSIELAKEKVAFPAFDSSRYLSGRFVRTLPQDICDGIFNDGIRNSLLLTIAPTGTVSITQAQNASGGVEPVFAARYERKVLQKDDSFKTSVIEDLGFRVYANVLFDGDLDAALAAPLPDYMVTTKDLTTEDHLLTQAAAQKYVDNSISKTINVPIETTFEDFERVYDRAYELGCKSCTTYRPDPASGRGAVLTEVKDKEAARSYIKVADMEITRSRPDVLTGSTYRLRWASLPYPMFVTINDEVLPDGRRVPFEVFINSKAVDYAHWVSALTRMISAVMRRGGDLTFLPEELKQVYSSRGGEFIDQRYVPSEVALIGYTLERHFREIGYLKGEPATDAPEVTPMGGGYAELGSECPACHQPTVVKREGCDTCLSCDWSRCG